MIHTATQTGLLLLLGLTFYVTGRGVMKTVSLKGDAAAAFGLGSAFWIFLIFTLSAAHLLRRDLLLLLMALFVLPWMGLWIVRKSAGPRRHGSSTGSSHGWILHAPWIVIGLLLLSLGLSALLPAVSWDADTYHLTVPRLYAENQGFFRIPFNVYSNWPMNIEMLFLMAMVLKDFVSAKLIHFGLGLLLVTATVTVSRQGRRTGTGVVAALLLLANPVVLYEMKTAYIDVAYAFFLFLAFAHLSGALAGRPATKRRSLSCLNWRSFPVASMLARRTLFSIPTTVISLPGQYMTCMKTSLPFAVTMPRCPSV